MKAGCDCRRTDRARRLAPQIARVTPPAAPRRQGVRNKLSNRTGPGWRLKFRRRRPLPLGLALKEDF